MFRKSVVSLNATEESRKQHCLLRCLGQTRGHVGGEGYPGLGMQGGIDLLPAEHPVIQFPVTLLFYF
jgi:hypothetical protein